MQIKSQEHSKHTQKDINDRLLLSWNQIVVDCVTDDETPSTPPGGDRHIADLVSETPAALESDEEAAATATAPVSPPPDRNDTLASPAVGVDDFRNRPEDVHRLLWDFVVASSTIPEATVHRAAAMVAAVPTVSDATTITVDEPSAAAVASTEQAAPSTTPVVPSSEYLVLDCVETATTTARGRGRDEFKFVVTSGGRLVRQESENDGDSSDDDDLSFDDGSD